jgi:MoxR-like ATPase
MATLNVDSITPKQAFKLAEALITINSIPFFFHGTPGCGKSELTQALADATGRELIILMLPQIDAQDLRGIQYPCPTTKRMVYFPPEFLPGPDSPPSILFLDELTAAEPRLQAAAYQLLLSRRIGSYTLPDNCYVCAAGNDTGDGAIAYEMGTALASRLLHIRLCAEPRAWLEWGLANNIHRAVLTLIQLKGDLLDQTQKQVEMNNMLGPNPRNWARVSKILSAVGVDNRTLAEPLVAGLVGTAAAADLFLTAQEMAGLPLPEEILAMDEAEFKKITVKTVSSLYGLTYSLIAFASDITHMRKAIKFLEITADNATNLPAGDCLALGMELLMERAIKSKLEAELIDSPEFAANYARIAEVCSVGDNVKSDKNKSGKGKKSDKAALTPA